MTTLAFIPARGGSKGIPRKNLALLGGKPLIEYTIAAARKSEYVDVVFLSTEDDEIAEVGKRLGIDVSYRRPRVLATDNTSMIDTLEHGILWYAERMGGMPEEIILLQPTSPLRRPIDIDNAIRQFRQKGSLSLISVHEMGEHPCECVVKDAIGNWNYLIAPPKGVVRRQDYQNSYFFINGAIYLARTETLLKYRTFILPADTALFEMPREYGVDIDTPLDLAIAQSIIGSVL